MTAVVDSHAHVFRADLPLAPVRRYAPDYDATLARFLGQLDEYGVARAVLIQPSFLGTDNSFMIEALRAAPTRLRGIAVVDPETSRPALEALAAAGVVGIRLNLIGGTPLPDLASTLWQQLLRNLIDLDWQVEIHIAASNLSTVAEPLVKAGVNIVVDHFGRPDPALGVNDPGFRYLLSLGGTGRVWVKLSGAYRNASAGTGDDVAHAAIPLLRDAFGWKHLVWGSDWPHTRFERVADYSTVWRQVGHWIPDFRDREIALSEAPVDLFHF